MKHFLERCEDIDDYKNSCKRKQSVQVDKQESARKCKCRTLSMVFNNFKKFDLNNFVSLRHFQKIHIFRPLTGILLNHDELNVPIEEKVAMTHYYCIKKR